MSIKINYVIENQRHFTRFELSSQDSVTVTLGQLKQTLGTEYHYFLEVTEEDGSKVLELLRSDNRELTNNSTVHLKPLPTSLRTQTPSKSTLYDLEGNKHDISGKITKDQLENMTSCAFDCIEVIGTDKKWRPFQVHQGSKTEDAKYYVFAPGDTYRLSREPLTSRPTPNDKSLLIKKDS